MKRGRPKDTRNRTFNDLTGPEKELMRKLARAHWTREELSKFFYVDVNSVDRVIKNTLKWKRKTKPKGLNNVKEKVLGSEG
jgi:hypothetical protein